MSGLRSRPSPCPLPYAPAKSPVKWQICHLSLQALLRPCRTRCFTSQPLRLRRAGAIRLRRPGSWATPRAACGVSALRASIPIAIFMSPLIALAFGSRGVSNLRTGGFALLRTPSGAASSLTRGFTGEPPPHPRKCNGGVPSHVVKEGRCVASSRQGTAVRRAPGWHEMLRISPFGCTERDHLHALIARLRLALIAWRRPSGACHRPRFAPGP